VQITSISWTNVTWNPVRGCSKISPGCKHCYAETFAERWRGVKGHPYEFGFDIRMVPGVLEAPLSWKKPRLIFVNSMSDIFHEAVDTSYIAQMCEVMAECRQHTFQVLTKRSERMHKLLNGSFQTIARLSNIWWGVSVENSVYVRRVYDLIDTPAQVRFVSCEPLLERIYNLPLNGIQLVIVGGESGAGARPMDVNWARMIRDRCRDCGTAFFLKQLGGYPNKREDISLFPEDLRIRELPSR
jgi:protein gp37